MRRIHHAWQRESGSKFFALDWSDVINRLGVWDQLAPETRQLLAHLKSGVAVNAPTLGSDLELLERADILYVTRNRVTARLSDSALSFSKLMRAIERHHLLERHDEEAFLAYLRDHLTIDERRELASSVVGWNVEWELARRATSVTWPRSFSDGSRTVFGSQESVAAAQKLVGWFLAHPQLIPLRDLPRHVPELSPDVLSGALRLCFEQMLLFPTFTRPEQTVVVGLWPSVTQRLAEPLPTPPVAFEAERQFDGAFLLDDMTVLLVAASAEPLRIRQNDGALFERTRANLATQLAPLPDWLTQPDWFGADARLRKASELLENMKLLADSGGTLRATRGASAWLARDEKERLRVVLDWLRADSASTSKPSDDEDERFMFDDETGYTRRVRYRSSIRIFPATTSLHATIEVQLGLLNLVRRAFAGMSKDGFTPVLEFLTYHSRCANPLLSGAAELTRALRNALSAQRATDESMELIWTNVLGDFYFERLLPLAGAAIGAAGDRTGMRLTDAGRYLLGLATDFEYHAGADRTERAVVVQPNFDIVFTAPAPRAEAAIGPFAERVGKRVGVLFRITRSSVLAAAAAGLTASQALAALKEISARPVPANVEREITGWFAECRRIALAPALLLRCPDAHTAARVLAAGGNLVRPVGETIVELVDPVARARLIKKLRGLGIFVEEAKGARTARKRRQSPWE